MEPVSLSPTSRGSARGNDVILRTTKTTRLLFRPLVIDNPHDKRASVKGWLVHQRKGINDEWADYRELRLSDLKAGESVTLELVSEALLKLVEHTQTLYQRVAEKGIPGAPVQFVELESQLGHLIRTSEPDLRNFLDAHPEEGAEALSRMLRWLSSNSGALAQVGKLEWADANSLGVLNVLAGIGTLKHALNTWESRRDDDSEAYWQGFFTRNTFALHQVFSYPVVIVQDKAYVGGKSIANTGGGIVDFLVQNEVTKNAIVVEIKTPQTLLLSSVYRDGVFPPSRDLAGAIVQVAGYRTTLIEHFRDLDFAEDKRVEIFSPRCVVVVGNSEELDTQAKKRSFELLRNGLRDVDVLTYDELFAKVKTLLRLLEEGP
ncbi:MAG: DUF4263 domain-containing protein [Chloroflexi bacterium]|nr:DUF4263 domain-containing protein [Chloroflexota bacterium]